MRAHVSFEQPAQGATLLDYLHEFENAAARITRLEQSIDAVLPTLPAMMRAVIDGLQSLRGVAKVSAVTLIAELGQLSRFAHPRKRPSLFRRDHRDLRALVHHLPPELSRSGRDDGGAGNRRVPHDHHALVLRYVPEYERRWSRFARPPGSSWRMDETAVAVRGGRHYLYRAVDRSGKSVASLLSIDRNMEAAQAFFRMAVCQEGEPWPEKVNVDGNSAMHRGLRLLAAEDQRWRNVEVRARRYLNRRVRCAWALPR